MYVETTLTGETHIWGHLVNERGEAFASLLDFNYVLAY